MGCLAGGGFTQQHDEFVAADPGHDVAVAQLAAHHLGHHLERPIARRMTEGVVDRLELVDIEIEQAERALVARGARKFPPGRGQEAA